VETVIQSQGMNKATGFQLSESRTRRTAAALEIPSLPLPT